MMQPCPTEQSKRTGGRKRPINSIGYDCVNVLVQRAICKVLRKAKSHDRSKQWNSANRERISKTSKDLYQSKREQRIQETTQYRIEHREHLMSCQLKREKERRDTDAEYHAAVLIRQRIRAAISRQANGKNVKHDTTFGLMGASPSEVVTQLGITSSNIGLVSGNDIDHVFPVTKYDLTDPHQQRMCFHVSNLRLMHNVANKKKSASLPSLSEAKQVERWCWPDNVDESMLS
jgi:hypothetical protein